jgi:hypothetical protein
MTGKNASRNQLGRIDSVDSFGYLKDALNSRTVSKKCRRLMTLRFS